jgi:DNA-binding PadR family transcriptional regulator
MSEKTKERSLTELEGAALGVVLRDGPCTSYAVKELFRASPSDFWSGSAGAIYPLMKRLEKRGLVASEAGSTGRRSRRDYRITALGRRAFERWLTDAQRAAGMGFDPLRTRLVFFDQLSPEARSAFRDDVVAAMEALPPPPPGSAAGLESLHTAWNAARLEAFERVLANLDGRGRNGLHTG